MLKVTSTRDLLGLMSAYEGQKGTNGRVSTPSNASRDYLLRKNIPRIENANSMRLITVTLLSVMTLAAVPVTSTNHSALSQAPTASPWIVYEGADGPGSGKQVVFVTGDEEYRSEEGMPMLAKILAERHGFTCTVLFAINPETGEIDPETVTNIPGLHLLDEADLMVLFIRWRELPDDQMKHIIDYTNSGKPIIGLRTATHPFAYETDKESTYARYHWSSEDPPGGYGQAVLGETWVNHHGEHGEESTRGLVSGLLQERAILNGVADIWGPTDVYGIRALPENSEVLVYGQVLSGMEPMSPPNTSKSIMPIAWTRVYEGETGNSARVFATTMGASVDLLSEDLRRLLVNAVYWSLDMEAETPERADVNFVGDYEPTYFGFGEHAKGVKPADLAIER